MFLTYFPIYECAKFSGSRAIVGLVGLVPSYQRSFMGSSRVINFFPWVFRGSQIFSQGHFVGPDFFSSVFCGAQIFSCQYFVGPQFLLVGISWAPIFFSWVFRGFKIFSRRQFRNFLVFAAWEKAAQRYI